MKVNNNETNENIKAHLLPKEKMREIGFMDYTNECWYFSKDLEYEISFNIIINKNDENDFNIRVIDEDFCQPYDYQYMLLEKPSHSVANLIKEKVEEIMEYLQSNGVLSGHIKGEYI